MQKFPKYFDALNEAQKNAVVHTGSPLLILAGAGSGKTRVITTKIAYLIGEKNVKPYSILAVTFTKKAANEMKERAIALEPKSSDSSIRTFHSFGAWFLRLYASLAKVSPTFTVYDDEDVATLILKAVPSLKKNEHKMYAHKISLAKDFFLTSDDDLSFLDSSGKLNEIYKLYEKRLSETGNVDFGDLIMKSALVMKNNPEVCAHMRNRFKVIMVDEYQDSNIAQFELLQILSGVSENSGTYVCVVGDDDQSIYKFRGAEIKNILTFQEKFPGTQIIKLEKNYRSTKSILKVADAVVSHNKERLGKTLFTDKDDGKQAVLAYIDTQDDEAEFCASVIQKSVEKQNASYRDWAILYRTNAQSLSFEQIFLQKKIPYAVIGSLKFYEREEVKDLLSFLSLLANENDELAFRRIVNKPARGIGEKSQDTIVDYAREKRLTLISSLNQCDALSKKAKEACEKFLSIFEELKKSFSEREQLSFVVEKIVKLSGLDEYYSVQDEITGNQKLANIQEFVNATSLYECSKIGLVEFLDNVVLDRTLGEESEKNKTDNRVSLITIHNTKGLEFPRVIITGMENKIFPRNDKTGEDLEEERRLFYVGITRAKEELYLTSCSFRRMYGRTEMMMPSVFLNEAGDIFRVIGKNVFTNASDNHFQADFASEHYAKSFSSKSDDEKKWKRGLTIYHDDYGYGQIVKTSVSDEGETVIIVQFETGGRKTFLPAYQSHALTVIRD